MKGPYIFFNVIFYVRRIFKSRIIRRGGGKGETKGGPRQREIGSRRRSRENKARLRLGKRSAMYYVVRKGGSSRSFIEKPTVLCTRVWRISSGQKVRNDCKDCRKNSFESGIVGEHWGWGGVDTLLHWYEEKEKKFEIRKLCLISIYKYKWLVNYLNYIKKMIQIKSEWFRWNHNMM